MDEDEFWRLVELARDPGAAGRTSTHVGTDFAGRDEVTVRIRLPGPSVERPDLDPAGDRTGWAALARAHVEALLGVLETTFGMQRPVLPDPAESERGRLAEAAREAADADSSQAWNLERTTRVPNLWSGRAPAEAIGELVRTLENGGRVRLPAQVGTVVPGRHRRRR